MMKSRMLIFVLWVATVSAVHAQDKSVYIEGLDMMRYSVEEIRVSPGSTLEITLKTVSSIPKSQMAHNWVLLKQDTDVAAFVKSSEQYEDNGYLDPELSGQVIASTDMLGGGEEDTIVFTVPEKKGTYVYVCTFPNHYVAGMKGKLIVE